MSSVGTAPWPFDASRYHVLIDHCLTAHLSLVPREDENENENVGAGSGVDVDFDGGDDEVNFDCCGIGLSLGVPALQLPTTARLL